MTQAPAGRTPVTLYDMCYIYVDTQDKTKNLRKSA